ncbi:RDD family protein, partial [Streptomyces sp. NPDC127044]
NAPAVPGAPGGFVAGMPGSGDGPVLGQPGAHSYPQAHPQTGASSPASARDLYPSASPASEGPAASAQQAPPPAASRDEPVERPSTGFAPPA